MSLKDPVQDLNFDVSVENDLSDSKKIIILVSSKYNEDRRFGCFASVANAEYSKFTKQINYLVVSMVKNLIRKEHFKSLCSTNFNIEDKYNGLLTYFIAALEEELKDTPRPNAPINNIATLLKRSSKKDK